MKLSGELFHPIRVLLWCKKIQYSGKVYHYNVIKIFHEYMWTYKKIQNFSEIYPYNIKIFQPIGEHTKNSEFQ